MAFRQYLLVAAIVAGIAATPAAGQFGSDSDRFITAVDARDGAAAIELLRARPTIVNARSGAGETALKIAIARRDDDWTLFLLSQGANPDAAARDGETPLIAAARIGYALGVSQLAAYKAKIDGTNRMGETALIVAVQQRHVPIVRMLLEAGADPDKADSAAGYSARDYARRDTRSREILRLIEMASAAKQKAEPGPKAQ